MKGIVASGHVETSRAAQQILNQLEETAAASDDDALDFPAEADARIVQQSVNQERADQALATGERLIVRSISRMSVSWVDGHIGQHRPAKFYRAPPFRKSRVIFA